MTASALPSRDRPVFLGGLASAGKTPLRLALDTHPALAMSRRTYLWTKHLDRYGPLDDHLNLDRCLSGIQIEPGIAELHIDFDRLRSEFETACRELGRHAATYERLFGLVHRQHADRLHRPRWGDQLGMIERHAARVFAAFPDARMVHLVRDPRSGSPTADPSRTRPGRLGSMVARWRHSAQLAIEHCELYRGRYLAVRYEDLLRSPRETIDAVTEFIDEQPVDEMYEVLERSVAELMTAAVKPRTSSAASADAFIERHARAELVYHGYLDAETAATATGTKGPGPGLRPIDQLALRTWTARRRDWSRTPGSVVA